MLQVAQVPQARALLASLAATVVAEGMRTGLFSMRDLVLGTPVVNDASPSSLPGLLSMPHRRLYVMLAVALAIVLYFTSRQVGKLATGMPAISLH